MPVRPQWHAFLEPWRTWLALAVVVGAVALGFAVRAQEPIESDVVPAEDPFTHMLLIRGHLADGNLDPPNEGATLYPPGMHAILSSLWTYTGAELHDIMLWTPVALGALAVLGTALVLWRHAGPLAAAVGALAMALAPEEIFRTTMMSPTAVDLAVLPFFLLTILEAMRGRPQWAVGTGVLATYFIVAHPWVLAILAPAVLGMTILWLIFGRDLLPGGSQAVGTAVALATVAAGLAAAVNACYSQCGLGFDDLQVQGSTGLDLLANVGAALAATVAGLVYFFRRAVTRSQNGSGGTPVTARLLWSGLALVALLAVLLPARANGFPEHVDLLRMFGWPILGLAAIGFILGPLAPNRAAFAGAALVIVTFPFVVHNPMDSEFWPHRTAAYFGIGAVLLAGTAAQTLLMGARRLAARLAPAGEDRTRRARTTAAAAIPVAVVLLSTGSVYAATPLEYETGWYRMYPPCEDQALRDLADEVDGDTVIVTGDWRPKLVLAAYTDRPGDVWFSTQFFHDAEYRDDTVFGLDRDGRSVIVVVDRHMKLENPGMDTSFLDQGWHATDACSGQGIQGARLLVYRAEVQ